MYETLGFWRALWLAPRWWVRKEYLVLVKDLRALEPSSSLPRGGGLPARWTTLTEDDIPSLRAANPKLSGSEMHRRWAEGQECLGGWIEGALAHYRWDTSRRAELPFLKKVFTPDAGDTLVFEAFTPPAFRGRGLHSRSTVLAFERDRARGFTRSVTLVAWWNVVALRVARDKAARELAGTVGYWELGVTTRHFATGAVRLGPDGEVAVTPAAAR